MEELLYGIGEENDLEACVEDAVKMYLRKCEGVPESVVILNTYRRVEAHLDPSFVLEEILCFLDYNYSSCDPTEPTKPMLDAAEAFSKKILEEYVPIDWDIVKSESIDIGKYWK